MMTPTVVFDPGQIDFAKPGKTHYQVAFHLDSAGDTRSFRSLLSMACGAILARRPRAWWPSAARTGTSTRARSRSNVCAPTWTRPRCRGVSSSSRSSVKVRAVRIGAAPGRRREHEPRVSRQPARHALLPHCEFRQDAHFPSGASRHRHSCRRQGGRRSRCAPRSTRSRTRSSTRRRRSWRASLIPRSSLSIRGRWRRDC